MAGCHSGAESCNDIAPGAIPQPNGTYDCQWIHQEMARAEQEKFVIYQYEWTADGAKLTPSGQEHVGEIAKAIACVPYPVVIEPVADDQLNAWRKAAVLDALACHQVRISPDRVLLQHSVAEGLYGQEAAGIAGGMLRSSAAQGGGGQNAGAALSGLQGTTLGGAQSSYSGASGAGVGGAAGVGVGFY